MIGEMRHAEDELEMLNNQIVNSVRIGVHSIAAASIVVPAIKCFKASFPDAHLEIIEDQTQRMLLPLREGEYDFLVATVPDEPDEGLSFEVLLDSKLGIFVRKQHPLAETKSPSLQEMVSYPWIYPLPHAHRTKEMENLFSVNSVRKPDAGITTMSPGLSRHALLNNDWVILTQGDLLLDELAHERVVELSTSDMLGDVSLAIVQRTASKPSEMSEKFISFVKGEAEIYNKNIL
jgi:DNA-binding transcriptional LysR family regulator